ncbi:peptidoglycan DD-metalloendopeptidase family protein [Methyloligella solikamskensis]|uniref:Peptidoglycan DD-metalloendopeptidase family protein n=1 Tax=Methyloligella solikamskensis TaxID=1177756 RepID=A0ABW3JAL0_9HYPH
MRETAFWSTLGRGAILAAAAMATAGVAGCSNSSRFDNPAYNLSSNGGAGYDQTTTASLGPVPPESVYGGSGGSSNYASTTPPRTTPGFDSRGRYHSGNSYASNSSYGSSSGSNSYGGNSNSYSNNSYSSGNSYSGGNSYKPTPVSYRPNANTNTYSGSTNTYPVQQAVYTPPAPKQPVQQPTMPPRQVASADRATLTGPGSKTITVQNGDSLYLYSLRYGVSVEAIQKANNLSGIGLTAGQKIVIPAKGATVGDDSYIIQAGDSLNSIAKKHGVSEQALASANNITNARSLQIGQELKIPSGGSAPQPTVQAQSAPKPQPKAPESNNNVQVVRTQKIESPDFAKKDEPKQQAASTPSPSQSQSGSQVASTKTLPSPDPMSGQRFRWPVNGRVISKFGSRADGGHNDGIDISVPQGTSVKAAENGVVAYAGNELKGYGNLVLIRHSNNWVSAYAHNENVTVKRGDKVTRGQTIAQAGATGSVSQPQLHFELRKGSRPVDPLKYMSTATAGAN